MSFRVGLDLVAIALVEDALDGPLADAYLRRVYTDRERADCRQGSRPDARRLASRFAAKEAVIKVLAEPEAAVPLTSIEVRCDRDAGPTIRLTDRAAELAAAASISRLAVSLTHDDDFAAAVVVAEVREPRPTDAGTPTA
jgi:holo-[acyl-carrier protein] synthase